MAKELGFQPKSLIKNIPSPSQTWKAPVSEWVRALYEKKIGSRGLAGGAPGPQAMRKQVIEFRNPEYPWPDRPKIPELVWEEPIESEDGEDEEVEWSEHYFQDRFEPPSERDIEEQNALMLRRQCLFRWAAQSVAVAMSRLPGVQKVAVFGAVAQPLEMEIPRFREFRRHRLEVLHECADLDLAVWTTNLPGLKELKNAMSLGLSLVQDTPYGGVAHHQVDVHILDPASGAYRGRLCIFGQCPKPGKRECLVPDCGTQPFLRQFEKYWFNPVQFEGEPRVTLFDRASGFLVRPPRIEAEPASIAHRAGKDDEDLDDEDVPF
ncbi:MAG: hypothetical protein JJE04_04755 [Acidobacteriia bacterium]|nr:hypothetical protein [Terriglobia bacterium]